MVIPLILTSFGSVAVALKCGQKTAAIQESHIETRSRSSLLCQASNHRFGYREALQSLRLGNTNKLQLKNETCNVEEKNICLQRLLTGVIKEKLCCS